MTHTEQIPAQARMPPRQPTTPVVDRLAIRRANRSASSQPFASDRKCSRWPLSKLGHCNRAFFNSVRRFPGFNCSRSAPAKCPHEADAARPQWPCPPGAPRPPGSGGRFPRAPPASPARPNKVARPTVAGAVRPMDSGPCLPLWSLGVWRIECLNGFLKHLLDVALGDKDVGDLHVELL